MIERALNDANAGRRTDRKPFKATVQFRSGNRRADVQVSDISALGARVAGVFMVREDDRFFLKIGTLAAIEARVVWVNDFDFGCEFLQPLSEIVLEALTNGRI